MKRTLFFMLLSACLSAPAAWAHDYDFHADGIYYNILSSDDKTVEVTYKSYSLDYSGDVIIPATVTNEGIEYRVTAIGFDAFAGCDSLTSVTIGENVQTIGDWAFYNCKSLTSITIPKSVTAIGFQAFQSCVGLTSIAIPNSVTTIGEGAFYDCYGLTSITIPESVTTISNRTFENCRSLTSITISDGVTTIDYYAFGGCTGLTSVTIPESVTAIGDMAFFYCTGLTSITIPNSVQTIGEGAFDGCSRLTEFKGKFASDYGRCLIVNNTLIAFAPKCGVAEYTIPDGITAIGASAFAGCDSLTSITIPNSVTSIGSFAFSGCDSLTSITIPKSVTSIGSSAFFNCHNLTSVTAYNPTPVNIVITDEWDYPYFAFERVDCANCKLYVPKGSVEAYRNAEGWSEFGEILPIDESSAITEIQQDNADGHVTVYNLQGVLVLETDDAADLKTLQSGAYIVNGKKMIIVR